MSDPLLGVLHNAAGCHVWSIVRGVAQCCRVSYVWSTVRSVTQCCRMYSAAGCLVSDTNVWWSASAKCSGSVWCKSGWWWWSPLNSKHSDDDSAVLAALRLPCWSKKKKHSHLHSWVNITSDKKKSMQCVVLEIVSAFQTKDITCW